MNLNHSANTFWESTSLYLVLFILFYSCSLSILALSSSQLLFIFLIFFQALFIIPLRVFLHSTHLLKVIAQGEQQICPHQTSTGVFISFLHLEQDSLGLCFSIDFNASQRSSLAAKSGLDILLHLSFSVLQKSLSCSHPVLQLDLSCRQIQLSPNGQYPESCQSLHSPKLQSNLQVFLMVLLSLDGPCLFLNFSSALTISSSVSAQLAQLLVPLQTSVSILPSLTCWVMLTLWRYFCLASYYSRRSYWLEKEFYLFCEEGSQDAEQFSDLNYLWSQAYFFYLFQVVLEAIRLDGQSGFTFFWGYWRSQTYYSWYWGLDYFCYLELAYGDLKGLLVIYGDYLLFDCCYVSLLRFRICCYLTTRFLNILLFQIYLYIRMLFNFYTIDTKLSLFILGFTTCFQNIRMNRLFFFLIFMILIMKYLLTHQSIKFLLYQTQVNQQFSIRIIFVQK